MMNASLTARLLLLSFSLAACAAEGDDVTDVEISASDPNGKADAIDGKRVRLRMHGRLPAWTDATVDAAATGEVTTRPDKVSIDAATSQTVVATGTAYVFRGTHEAHRLQQSPWAYDRLLSISVDNAAALDHQLGFLLWDRFGSDEPLRCERGELRLNFFAKVVINLPDRELYANDTHTFTFAECGIEPDGLVSSAGPDKGVAQWMFDAFVVPLATAGRLQGTYDYNLKVEIL